ncbi:unnamed protein product [Kuraishia capsulata CBS 1993]|uniref:Adenylate kinase isoenzyme 6 homolog n=1 Tax=Kuraishia capsulata CBS 1993 TaxID=1382522 RepID=W6MRP5_9ASCO|nr:uncharacterized protein KUCA_T00000453001 [Kuraishia capsulata CBS 1993]CDK24490.1 unnamed protein product [Kuraishia capsulata CBS 1993]
MKLLSISDVAKERDCIESYDEARDSSVVDEDKLLDSLETDLRSGGVIVDWHVCDIFPERLIDLVVVLRCSNSTLYERLEKRGYKKSKISENVEAEIMQVILEEAQDSYDEHIVIELNSDSKKESTANVKRLVSWLKKWIDDHPQGVSNELQVTDSESDANDDDDDEK